MVGLLVMFDLLVAWLVRVGWSVGRLVAAYWTVKMVSFYVTANHRSTNPICDHYTLHVYELTVMRYGDGGGVTA